MNKIIGLGIRCKTQQSEAHWIMVQDLLNKYLKKEFGNNIVPKEYEIVIFKEV
jgi:hypothetical protein